MLKNILASTYTIKTSNTPTTEIAKRAIGFWAIAIAIIVFIITCILIGKARKKDDAKTMSDITKKAKEALKQSSTAPKDNSSMFCEYCGAQNNPSDFKCSGCGAPLHKKKK